MTPPVAQPARRPAVLQGVSPPFVSRLLAKDPAQRSTGGGVWDALKEINDRHSEEPQPSSGLDLSGEVVVSHAEAADGAAILLRIAIDHGQDAGIRGDRDRQRIRHRDVGAQGEAAVQELLDVGRPESEGADVPSSSWAKASKNLRLAGWASTC
ncbi:hypothetical protein [Streptomyces sp. NPDC001816]|uniref:hypothetical protein n=1 Tax=Streptomyces sp. NPDC001816 TaxID=3364612 RepID=UPI0036A3EC42